MVAATFWDARKDEATVWECCAAHRAWRMQILNSIFLLISLRNKDSPDPRLFQAFSCLEAGVPQKAENPRDRLQIGSVYPSLCPWRPIRAKHSRVFVGRKKQSRLSSSSQARHWRSMLGAELQRCPRPPRAASVLERKKLRHGEDRVAVTLESSPPEK